MAWYEEFFGEDYMRFHLRGGEAREQRAPAECDFVVSALELQPGARVLDLCCGQGRHAVELGRRGFHVTGFDLSDYLLGLAREKALVAGVEVEFVRGDMRELPWEEEFDAVINLFTAFGYFESEQEDQKVLDALATSLRPGGRVVVDVLNRSSLVKRFQRKDWDDHEGHVLLSEREWDEARGRITCHLTLVAPDGQRRQSGHVLRMYTHSELVQMMESAGLEWQRSYGGFDGSDYGVDSRRMIVVASRPL
jgi:SAM-dependent methyltransferase